MDGDRFSLPKSHGSTVSVTGATTDAEVTNANTSGIQYIGTLIQGDVILGTKEETGGSKHSDHGKGKLTVSGNHLPGNTAQHEESFQDAKSETTSFTMSEEKIFEPSAEGLKAPPLPEGKSYHAFFSHSSDNTDWVEEVITYLESPELGFRCVHHERDFHAGVRIMDNISHFVSLSWKYILILTPAFISSSWCKFERDVMMKLTTDERKDLIIPVLLETCDLPLSLQIITYVDARGDKDWRVKLVKAVRRPESLSQDSATILQRIPEGSMNKQQFLQELVMKEDEFDSVLANHKGEILNNEMKKRISLAQVSHKFKFIKDQMSRLLDAFEKDTLRTVDEKFCERNHDFLALQQSTNYLKTLGVENIDTEYKRAVETFEQWKYFRSKSRDCMYRYVIADKAQENMKEGVKKIRFGKLEQKFLPPLYTVKDREQYLKDITPSSAFFSTSARYQNTVMWIIQYPYFEFDPETLWPNRTILPDGSLCNQPPETQHLPLDKRLKEYYGAVATATLAAGSIYYWENKLGVDLEKELGERQLIFEVTLSTRGVFDEDASAVIKPGTLTACVFRCRGHDIDSICLEVFKEGTPFHHYSLLENRVGKWPTVVFGFLLDTIRQRWTIYDTVKRKRITTMTGILDAEQFTPQFGVHAQHAGSVKVHLVTGQHLDIPDNMHELLKEDLLQDQCN